MTQVTITPEAATELRERVARYGGLRDGVMILGPMGPGYRMVENAEEARLLELAYGEAQRWVINIRSLKELDHLRDHAGRNFDTMDVDGIRVMVVTHESNVNLHVELAGDRLLISEQ